VCDISSRLAAPKNLPALEQLRLISGLIRREFCKKIGIPLTTYERWLRQKKEPKLTPNQWVNLSEILELPLDEVITFLHNNPPEQS